MTEIIQARPVHRQTPPHSTCRSPAAELLLLLIILAVAIGGYALGLNIARQDIAAGKQLIQQLQTESQKLQKQVHGTKRQQHRAAVQADDDVKPRCMRWSRRRTPIILKPNQSIIVADGHLVLGLVGTPDNDQHQHQHQWQTASAAPGDIINVAPDASTACQVMVQSFRHVRGGVTATCSGGTATSC